MPNRKARRFTIADMSWQTTAYHEILERIDDGHYPPGHRLVAEVIGRELEIDAVPVQAAIRQLADEGRVRYDRNVGACVAPVEEEPQEPT
jgi:DNA-binding GntR family transcriptional regulator